MKNRFLKSVLVLSTVLALVNCSEETADAINNLDPQANQPTEDNPNTLPADEPCWLLNAGSDFLIYSAGIVTDVNGNVVGTITFIDGTLTGSIVAIDGSVIVENVDASALPLVTRATVNATTTPTTPASSAGTSTTPTLSSATDPTPTLSSGSNPTIPVASSSSEKTAVTSSATNPQVQSSSSNQQQPKSSSATSSNQCDGKCLDSASGKCVDPHTTLKGSHDEQYAYDESCKINCYYDPTNQNCKNLGGGSAAPASSTSQPKSSSSVKSSSSQQQQQPKSSSSAKSSSSQQQIKSSSSQATNPNASAEEAKYLNAGAGGQQGFATRYWDCCMPHCAWPEHGGKAKTCDAKGKTPIGNNNGSICSNGQGTTCTSQTPIIVSEKLAYAFAATPGNDNTCGKCFALTFTGQGKYETKANHQALKGKTLVVMASNIGYDVQGGQFDVMIPGGGVGAFNGCANMGWGDQGAQYGGLLSKCEDEVGYDGDLLTKRKQCLTEKCNKSFANDAEAKEGCLFLATWMEAAGNPLHTYKEVDCPQALIQKF
ncbi:glycosyl hydrolase family 5 [Fibrobacter sp. UWB10]|uniref:glycosyl hydrolase family 5 n=1 Tax=Fibrobacter sp. UWB10 TaxID=1896201 RepID=UPI002402DDF6|nr:glycosyl hydrolase family 5 [Fibrobacter sp. UWB10]SMP43480.1 Glycosyl hydrolase family 45 [Fibrobacter sp. UWB10]